MDINNLNILRSKIEELRGKIIGAENLNKDILNDNVLKNLDELEKETI